MIFQRLYSQATDSEKKKRLLAMTSMVLVAFFWALLEALGRFIPKGYSPIQTVWSRYFVHILFMLVFFAPRVGTRLIKTECLQMQIIRSLLMFGMPLCYIIGVSLIPSRNVWTISWSSSIMLLFLAMIFLKERISNRLWFITIIGWIGIWLILDADLPSFQWGVLASLGMGFCFALYNTMTRIMRSESSYANLFHTALWVFCLLSLFIPLTWKTPDAGVAAVYLGIGFFGYLALFFLDKALELAPAALLAPLIYTQPIWALLFDFMFNGSSPRLHTFIGALIIVTCAAYLFVVETVGVRQLVRCDT